MKIMRRTIPRVVVLLTPLVMGLPFAMDIYVPAIPSIASLFQVSDATMQLTLTLFMFTAGILQLIVGPLSDRYGRKPIALSTSVIFIIGSLLCAISQNALQLILFRVVQAIGSCGMLVVSFAVVRDLFSGKRSAQAYSFLNGMNAFSPMLAPFIGSYLDVHLGWQFSFLALLLIGFAAVYSVSFKLPETLLRRRRNTIGWSLINKYLKIARHNVFAIYSCVAAFGLSYLFLFCSISPYIIIRQLHIPVIDYGFYFCFMGISFFVGSFASAYVVGRIGIYRTVILGIVIALIGGLTMAIWYFITGLTIANFIWPMLLIGIGGTFCMGSGNAGAMEHFAEHSGSASALSGAFRFVFSGVLGSLVVTDHVKSTLPLAIPAIVFSIVSLIVFLYARKLLEFHE